MGLSALAPKERTIGRNVYQVRILPAGEGLRSAAKLANLIGPGLKGLGDGDDKGFAFLAAFLEDEKLADRLEYFTKLFARYTAVQIEGAGNALELSSIYEVHFSANYFELLQWLAFCIEVNHASFFTGAGLSVQKLVALVQDALNSRYRNPAKKPGTSGVSSSPDESTKPITA